MAALKLKMFRVKKFRYRHHPLKLELRVTRERGYVGEIYVLLVFFLVIDVIIRSTKKDLMVTYRKRSIEAI